MSFPDDSFPVAMTSFALHEKPRTTAAAILSEMSRVVVPGGDIVVADFYFTEQTSRLAEALIGLIERGAGGEHYRNFRDFRRRGGLSELLEHIPLEVVSVESLGLGSVGVLMMRNNKNGSMDGAHD